MLIGTLGYYGIESLGAWVVGMEMRMGDSAGKRVRSTQYWIGR